MGKRRPKLNLTTRKPQARSSDLAQLFSSDQDAEQAAGIQLVAVRLDAIEADPTQPRTYFDEESLSDLSASLEQDGLIQPIEVVQIDREHYRIVHGERRWRAAQRLNWETIPAIVRRRDYDEITRFVRQLVENIQREDLNDVDRAAGLARLRDMMQEELNAEVELSGGKQYSSKATWAKVAKRLGFSRQRVSQLRRLLDLPVEIRDSIKDGSLTERDARIFHGLKPRQQRALHRARVIDGKLSQAESKRVADYIKKGATSSVAEAIKQVRVGGDQSSAEIQPLIQAQRRIQRISRAMGELEIDTLNSAERRQLLSDLEPIHLRMAHLLKALKRK